ncbi:MAG TPA: DUF72 domain-containing protein [Egibacteraceae bacterium]
MTVFIGTSGWQYADWREAFYPRGVPQRAWLEHYAARFAVVEVNASFYHLPRAEVFAAWAARTPDDFVLCPKVSRYLTHMKKLREPHEPVARFVARAAALGAKRGPALLQLPHTFAADPPLLAAALDCFPDGWRLAVELRHPSWFTGEIAALLAERDAALVHSDRDGRPQEPLWRTASWGYVRFHHGRATPRPCYGRRVLDTWAQRLATRYEDADVYAFFNNDPRCCAVRDARLFALACRRHGLAATRVPAADEVRVRRDAAS